MAWPAPGPSKLPAAAGVNKALLYYYFESKEKLYAAALEMVSARVRDRSMAVFLRDASPGERMLRAALDHFDRILTQREFQSLMQQEMMRLHKGEEGQLPILVKRVFGPLHAMFQSMVREGIASGELIEAEWLQMMLAALGGNVFYFLSAPVWRLVVAYRAVRPGGAAGAPSGAGAISRASNFSGPEAGCGVGREGAGRHADA